MRRGTELSKLLLRYGHVYSAAGTTWNAVSTTSWLRGIRFDQYGHPGSL